MRFATILISILLIACSSISEDRQRFTEFAKQIHQRAQEPYVFAGEDAERLQLKADKLLSELGDSVFAKLCSQLSQKEQSSFRLVFSRHDLTKEGYVKTIAAIEMGTTDVSPAENAGIKWSATDSPFVDTSGWKK